MALLHYLLLFLHVFTGIIASPVRLHKRVTFNYVWDIQNTDQYQDPRQRNIEREFEEEMQGVYEMARVAADFIAPNSMGAQTTTFGYYLGYASTPLEAQLVRGNYQRVRDLPNNNRQLTIRFTDRDSTEHPGAQAWTSASGTINIYLPRYERYTRHRDWAPNPFEVTSTQLERTLTRSLILLHELMHIRGIGIRYDEGAPAGAPLADLPYPSGFNDQHPSRVYGQTAANRLALREGYRRASANADNVALFALALWTDQFNQIRVPNPADLPPAPPTGGQWLPGGPPAAGQWARNGSRDAVRTPPRGTTTWWLSGYGHSSSRKEKI